MSELRTWDLPRVPVSKTGWSSLAESQTAARRLPGMVQGRLRAGPVSDPLEAEADAMAAHVLGDKGARPLPLHATLPGVQRKCGCSGSGEKCAACKDDEDGTIHRKAVGDTTPMSAPPAVKSVVGSTGQPLDAATRAFMEPRFGFDFSRVRIHSDSYAAQSADSIQALAYTVNNSIAFSAGSYAPQTERGRRLLAHELAHVVQQGAAPPVSRERLSVGSVNDAAEVDAERSASAVLSGKGATVSRPRLSSAGVIRRAPATADAGRWTEPQDFSEIREARPPLVMQKENHTVTVAVTRRFQQCNWAKVDDKRSASFYNPKLSDLALDRRVCSGSKVFDAFVKEIDDGTNTKGVEVGGAVNISGANVQGQVEVGGVAQDKNNTGGVGGKIEGSLKVGGVNLDVNAEYIRNLLNKRAGANPNEVDATAGGEYDGHTVTVTGTDLLGKRQITFNVGGKIGKPENVECSICYLPPPLKIFDCSKVLHTEPDKPKQDTGKEKREQKTLTPEYRYYFAWDSVKPSEEPSLQVASDKNMDDLRKDLEKPEYPGFRVTSISGYASPEGLERSVNRQLSQDRAKKMAEFVSRAARKSQWHGPDTLPEAIGRSELLGSNPAPPSAHLREVIAKSVKRSAEEVTKLLTGKEILPAEMTPEFLDLFGGTTTDEWMQLFGLGNDDPIRPEVEGAVNAFLDSKGKGSRPWERVFRFLRFGAVTLEGVETVSVPGEDGANSAKEPGEAAADGASVEISEKSLCDRYGEIAEQEGKFGPPIDPDLLLPQSFVKHGGESCPTVAGGGSGKTPKCDYQIHDKKPLAPPAPKIAPKQIK